MHVQNGSGAEVAALLSEVSLDTSSAHARTPLRSGPDQACAVLWKKSLCCGMLQNPHVQLQKAGAAAAHAWSGLRGGGGGGGGGGRAESCTRGRWDRHKGDVWSVTCVVVLTLSAQQAAPGLSVRGGGGVRNANRKQRSRGRSLLHGQDMGRAQDHRSGIEQCGGWRLAVGGPWGLSFKAVLNKINWGS